MTQHEPPAAPQPSDPQNNQLEQQHHNANNSQVITSQLVTEKAEHDLGMIAMWVSLLVMVVFVALMQFGPLGISPTIHIDDFFTPEPWAGLIWIVAFILLAIWIMRAGRAKHHGTNKVKKSYTMLTVAMVVLALCTLGWTLCWHAGNAPWAVIFVVLMTVLTWMLERMAYKRDHTAWAQWPFQLLGAWLVVQTIVDLFRAVVHYLMMDGHVSDFSQEVFTILLGAALMLAACALKTKHHNWLFGAVALFSLLAVAIHLMNVAKLVAVIIVIEMTLAAIYMYVPWKPIAQVMATRQNNAQPKEQKH
ncbi:hypothetical protein D2E26_0577 [Bifidobacterium dolichotidis]|uniref:Uncharacterized protein n=1 Tax=Bifidobacterium dolichotidis TaxID=2306976 RepID=A0A430FSY2_9BIFI|nr:hypothetical protein [Bifidobacterium dolichotidis]RSX56014.1 hypothetical protein D2E26_0577 [Bifidobacterium dolichotidis]